MKAHEMQSTEHLTPLLSEDAAQSEFYWKKKDYKSSTETWNTLAKINHISAAISARDEKHEQEKSAGTTELLRNELNDGVLLDLGCGYGRVAKYLLPKRTFHGYIGIDSSTAMLKLFFDRYKQNEKEQKTPLLLLHSDIHEIPLTNNSVDNVLVSAVFLHNHKSITKKSIGDVHRILKPEGKLFIISSFPNLHSLMGLQGALYSAFLKITGNEFKNGPVRYFSKKEVASMLRNFKKVTITPVGFSVLPKSIIILPSFFDIIYRTIIANPFNSLAGLLIPDKIKKIFCTHYDIIANK